MENNTTMEWSWTNSLRRIYLKTPTPLLSWPICSFIMGKTHMKSWSKNGCSDLARSNIGPVPYPSSRCCSNSLGGKRTAVSKMKLRKILSFCRKWSTMRFVILLAWGIVFLISAWWTGLAVMRRPLPTKLISARFAFGSCSWLYRSRFQRDTKSWMMKRVYF